MTAWARFVFGFGVTGRAVRPLLAAAALAAAAPAQAQTEVVGTVSGQVGVTPSGGATYAVPIVVPPGTTGVQPKLALSYNSQGGNGLVGVGWSVSGLSVISRCGTDLYHDDPANGGAGIDPVDYDANDKFCLNGQRLVAVSGSYGASGTEYRTAFEEFSKIVSYGTTGGGPTRFRVWKKTGEILDYGNTADSRVVGQGRTAVRTWALSRLADVKGNYITFTYANTQSTGEFHIDRIDYTGNDAESLAPYNHVDFVYQTRPDTITSYLAGDKITITKRLTNIKAYAGSTLAQDYRIAYERGASNRSRVASLTQCASANTCF
ncbi:MAG: hypothetical protein MI824_01650, partial [Hyphomicrobiales bacterium]|nr:hypothetical protein [Hyphomicrobiales bacterium]